MIYHLITGDHAAEPLKEAIALDKSLPGEVVIMKDVLSLGPIQRTEGQSFSELRTAFWQEVAPFLKNQPPVDDLERLLETGNQLAKNPDARIWIWMAPLPADICMYLWCLKYLDKYADRLFVVNIAGLPFLDADSKMFFPRSIADILPAQVLKACKLARPLNATEMDIDRDEWERLTHENSMVRILDGGKKITGKPENFYDQQLTGFCIHQYQKASRIAGQAMSKYNIPTGDYFLGWRLRQLYEQGRLIIQGDPNGKMKDYEVKIPGEDLQLELGI